MTADRLADELLRYETALARRDPTGLPGGLAGLLDDEFVEIGASGRTWDREATVAALVVDVAAEVTVEAFVCERLGGEVALATYDAAVIDAGGRTRRSRRSSVWVRRAGGWRIRFHQGTPMEGS